MRAAAQMSPARWAALCDGGAMGGAVHAMGDAKQHARDGRRNVQRSTTQGQCWARRVGSIVSAVAAPYWTVVVEKINK
ncbi:hypothetical protein U1Q18_028932 [Sarracenia purpurea var. burkii]